MRHPLFHQKFLRVCLAANITRFRLRTCYFGTTIFLSCLLMTINSNLQDSLYLKNILVFLLN
uniref:Uncharacterized protein n=1 Tax=Oryza brachyantha TaxID=4533 RepID=J3L023_ORYBR